MVETEEDFHNAKMTFAPHRKSDCAHVQKLGLKGKLIIFAYFCRCLQK